MKEPSHHAEPRPPVSQVLFVNELRLNARQWIVVSCLVVSAFVLAPRIWTRLERFETGPDYRIPYPLSKDYWLYERRLEGVADPSKVVLLGDSVVWGEYVLPDGSLSHFLNREAGERERFINGGVNGLFPLAMEGLIRSYGGALRKRKVMVQCNVLWMSSPKADLQVRKEEKFNHSRLTPQFLPVIPCYAADAQERLGVLIERNCAFFSWVSHLQSAYLDDRSILSWTLLESDENPPRYPNSYKNPLSQITWKVPVESTPDSQRGPSSPRHKAWDAAGRNLVRFDWVDLETSLQWSAFQRLVSLLELRDNDVLVVFGPFNEHMMDSESRARFERVRADIVSALQRRQIPVVAAPVLPSELYADASHPLTAGYERLAKTVYEDPVFVEWLGR